MLVGFAIFFLLLIFGLGITFFLILKQFSANFEIAEAVKDSILTFVLVTVLIGAGSFFLKFADYFFQQVYPARIFSKNFEFSPTSDVEILNGSTSFFFSNQSESVFLKFRAKKETVRKIIEQRNFYEISFDNLKTDNKTLRNFVENNDMQIYLSKDFKEECDEELKDCAAYLVHNQESGEVYFCR